MKTSWLLFLAIMVMASSCGDNHLVSIQVLPLDTNILFNNTVYINPGDTVQYQIQGWYSNRTAQTLSNSQGTWTSTSPSIATVDGNGLVTSAGPLGVTTITVVVSGHKSTTVVSVCDFGLCPPPTTP
jgi:alpha-amylase